MSSSSAPYVLLRKRSSSVKAPSRPDTPEPDMLNVATGIPCDAIVDARSGMKPQSL